MKNPLLPRCTVAVLAAIALAGCREQAPTSTDNSFKAEIALSTNQIRVGDPILLTATVTHPANTTVQWPDLNQGRDLLVRSQQQTTRALNETTAQTETRIKFTSFSVTNHIVSTGTLVCAEQKIPFPFATFEVVSSLTESNTPLPGLKPVATWAAPSWARKLWSVLAVVLLAGLLAGLVAWWHTRYHRRQEQVAPPPPPHETALAALSALRGSPWLEAVQPDPFFTEVSFVLRTYIEEALGLRAREQTTEEFMYSAGRSEVLNPHQKDLITQFMIQCDLIKFAKARADRANMLNALDSAIHFVRETAGLNTRTEEPA